MTLRAASPGSSRRREAYGETTLVVDRARIVEACTHLRDELGFNFLSDVTATDYLGWGDKGVSGYIGTARRPRHQRAVDAGPATAARAEAEALRRSTTTCSPSRTARRACACRCWLDDGEPRRQRRRACGRPPTGTSARPFDLMGIVFEGHPNLARILHGRRLGRPPAAQGLPDRRRARPVLGGDE